MALPIVDNQGTDQTQQAIDSLGQIIKAKVNSSIAASAKTILPNIPKMINELTVDLKKGPVHSFTRVIVKLEKLVEKLGLDLREYSTELADLLIQRETKARESEETVTKLREQNIVARVNKETKEVEVLTRSQIRQETKIFKLKEKNISKIETEINRDRKKLQVGDSLSNKEKKLTKDRIVKNTKELDKLKKDRDTSGDTLSTTANTGQKSKGLPMFLDQMKMAFMEPFQAIGESFNMLKDTGKGSVELVNFLTGGIFLKAFKGLWKGLKAIGGFFSLARLILIAKFALVIAAIVFVATKIKAIGAFFIKLMDWFKNSWLGKKLGLVDEDSAESKSYDINKAQKEIDKHENYMAEGDMRTATGRSREKIVKKLRAELDGLKSDLSMIKATENMPTIKEEMDKADIEIKSGDNKANKNYYDNKKAQKDAVAEFEALNLANNDHLAKKGIDTSIFNNVVTDNSQASNANISVVDDSKDGTIIDTSDSRWTD